MKKKLTQDEIKKLRKLNDKKLKSNKDVLK